jgi:dihydrofolate reductase
MILITDSEYGISKHNKIPWHFKEDLQFFNKITSHNVCIMGSTTAKDLGKPLRNRINIVISSNDDCKDLGKLRANYDYNDFIVVRSIDEALKEARRYEKEIFIVGGSRLYNQMLKSPLLSKIYYTHINQSFDCDNIVEPILDRPDMNYEILNILQKDNIQLTFYLITRKQ